MDEIEIKLKYSDRKLVTNKLKNLGAKLLNKFELNDIYFGMGHTNMSNANNLVRIRKKNKSCELTYKGKAKDSDNVWTRLELSTSIGDPQVIEQILLQIGFNRIKENKSKREIWDLNSVEIAFIDFILPSKLEILEIEGPSEKSVQKVTAKLGNLVTPIGEEQFKRFDKNE